MSTRFGGQIGIGSDVYGSEGDKIGSVADIGSNYFIVEKGFLFTTDVYVPMSAVTNVDEDGIYLNVTKDAVEDQGWDSPPMEDTADTEMSEATDAYRARAQGGMGTPPVGMDDTTTMERAEEHLTASKRQVQTGQVRVGKDVVTEEQSMDVPVTREEVRVNRRSVDRPAESARFEEEDISIPVTEERVDVGKEARVVEELDVEKQVRPDTERVSGTVRREEFRVDEDEPPR
jgi:uncharacterized protein (TIGR02271 family)